MENLCCNKMSSFTNSSNSKLDSTKFETRVDKTYNLGKIYVTVSVYRNLSLLRKGTNYPPIFFGPMFIHRNSDFDTYSTFFGQLSARFVDNSFADLRIGSDEEASIRKAVRHFFQGSQVIVCTRHLKENLIRNGHKVSAV